MRVCMNYYIRIYISIYMHASLNLLNLRSRKGKRTPNFGPERQRTLNILQHRALQHSTHSQFLLLIMSLTNFCQFFNLNFKSRTI